MAVQKKRVTRSKRDKRRGQDKINKPQLSLDPETGELHMRHHLTQEGYYRGKRMIPPKPVKEEAQ